MTASNADFYPNSSEQDATEEASATEFPAAVLGLGHTQAEEIPAPFPSSRIEIEPFDLMTVEQVQKTLNRSRASVYRYANTDPVDLDPPIDPRRLNPEPRKRREDPLLFAPSEVERFARDILGIRGITIEVQESPEAATQKTLEAILKELQAIRTLLERSSNP